MLEMLVKGGPVMVPIALCSILAVAIFLERLWFFWVTRFDPQSILASIKEPLKQGKYLEAVQLSRQMPGPVAGFLASGIAYADKGVDEMRTHLDVAGRDEVSRMERGLPALGLITTIAPLLGLLGTVTGIIRSFRVLSALQGIEGPSALSSGIAEALITTAAGLIVAIPTAALYEWFSAIVDKRVQSMNRIGSDVVDMVAERGEA